MPIQLEFNVSKAKLMALRLLRYFAVVALVPPAFQRWRYSVSGGAGRTDMGVADTRKEDFVQGNCVVLPARGQLSPFLEEICYGQNRR